MTKIIHVFLLRELVAFQAASYMCVNILRLLQAAPPSFALPPVHMDQLDRYLHGPALILCGMDCLPSLYLRFFCLPALACLSTLSRLSPFSHYMCKLISIHCCLPYSLYACMLHRRKHQTWVCGQHWQDTSYKLISISAIEWYELLLPNYVRHAFQSTMQCTWFNGMSVVPPTRYLLVLT